MQYYRTLLDDRTHVVQPIISSTQLTVVIGGDVGGGGGKRVGNEVDTS